MRRRQLAATNPYAVPTVRDLLAELQEAEIRARIKAARKQAGLTQTEMAELLEVIPRTVQNYENDHVPWSRLRDIAEITGMSTRWLLHGEDGGDVTSDELERLERIEVEINRQGRLLEALAAALETELEDRVSAAAKRAKRQDLGTPRAVGRRG